MATLILGHLRKRVSFKRQRTKMATLKRDNK
jgi:hypothetical protein